MARTGRCRGAVRRRTRVKPLLGKVSNVVAPTGIRDGQWNMHFPKRQRGEGEIERYDLATDRGESTNFAAQHPDVVQRRTTDLGDR